VCPLIDPRVFEKERRKEEKTYGIIFQFCVIDWQMTIISFKAETVFYNHTGKQE